MTLYYISFSEKINSVTNNNAIYVLGVSIILSVTLSPDDKLSEGHYLVSDSVHGMLYKVMISSVAGSGVRK